MKIAGPSLRIDAPVVLIAILAISLTTFLIVGKFISTSDALERSRIELVTDDLRNVIETGLDLGLTLQGLANAQAAIEFEAQADPAILSISLHDEAGTILFHTGAALADARIPARWKAQRERHWQLAEADALIVGNTLSTASGNSAGGMILRYSRQHRDARIDAVTRSLRIGAAVVIIVTTTLALLVMSLLMRHARQRLPPHGAADIDRHHRQVVRLLFVAALSILLLSQLAMAAYAWSVIDENLHPELESKAVTVAGLMAHEVSRALDAGIPLAHIDGVTERFNDIRRAHPDIAALQLVGKAHDLQASSGTTMNGLPPVLMPVRASGAVVASVLVSMDGQAMASHSDALLMDIAIVMLTSMLIAFEALRFVVVRIVTEPLQRHLAQTGLRSLDQVAGHDGPARRDDDRRLDAMRILTFLFLFAEILSRPVMPAYAITFRDAPHLLHDGVLASLPVSLFLLSAALGMPFAGNWSGRVGRQRSYVTGAFLMCAGLLLTAMAPLFAILLAGRILAGIGYALMFMSCQGVITDHAQAARRGEGAALFVGAAMVAEICGPAIGGLLAERIGLRAVFFAGALVVLLAARIGKLTLGNQAMPAGRPATAMAPIRLRILLRDRGFASLCLLAGIPAKMMYAGFLIYLVPIMLVDFGSSHASVGRHVMVYGLVVLVLGPFIARLADRYALHARLVGFGGILSAAGMMMLALRPEAMTVLAGIVALGIGQAMSLSAQTSLITRIAQARAEPTGAVIGMFRMLERLGSFAGAALAGAMVAAGGGIHATLIVGMIGMLCSLMFLLAYPAQESDP